METEISVAIWHKCYASGCITILFLIIIDSCVIRCDNIIQLSIYLFDVTFKIDLLEVAYYLKLFQRYLICYMIKVL